MGAISSWKPLTSHSLPVVSKRTKAAPAHVVSALVSISARNILINPNQVRDNGLTVDCCPQEYDKSSLHAIYIPEEDINLPFQMHGCISYLPIRLPTEVELAKCRYLEMTSEREWKPYSDSFQHQEKPLAIKENQISEIRETRNISAITSNDRRCDIDAPTLAERLGISHHIATETLKNTTQLASRNITFACSTN